MEEGNVFCRICLDGGSVLSPLKKPCNCTGSMAFVHVACLSKWRSQFPKTHDKHICCAVCTSPYRWKEHKPVNYWLVVSILGSAGTSCAYYYLMLRCFPILHMSSPFLMYRPSQNPTCVVQAVVGGVSLWFKTWSLVIVNNPKQHVRTTLSLSSGIVLPFLAVYVIIFLVDITRFVLPILFSLYLLIEWMFAFLYVLEE